MHLTTAVTLLRSSLFYEDDTKVDHVKDGVEVQAQTIYTYLFGQKDITCVAEIMDAIVTVKLSEFFYQELLSKNYEWHGFVKLWSITVNLSLYSNFMV